MILISDCIIGQNKPLININIDLYKNTLLGFPGNSAGKESASNAGDPSLIPGLGRSPGEGIDYPL